MVKWLVIIAGMLAFGGAIALTIGRTREDTKLETAKEALFQGAEAVKGRVDFESFSDLPSPVARYFRHVLTDGQPFIKSVQLTQSGELRTSTESQQWPSFTATHVAVPGATGFLWNARVKMPLGTHVCVVDGLIDGKGSGAVSILSAFPIAAESGLPELNAGALHRYLAESVWYPTALLPESGVVWYPIDDYAVLASLTKAGTTVSLEFRFNDAGEVTAIFSPERFGKFDGGYKRKPWEGHFRDYRMVAGMKIPHYGEVGWYDENTLQLVWKGDVLDVEYQFVP